MNTQKFFISGLAGGVTAFFTGYLVYGIALTNFFINNMGSATGVMREMDQMVWWALILGNMLFGFLLSYIFNKVGSVNTLGSGAIEGAMILFLVAASVDFTMYGTTNINNLNATIVDIVAMAVLGAVTGAVVGLVNGMGKKP